MKDKKICFISLGNIYLCPYISKYISLINCNYDVIYWNRHKLKEEIGADETFSFNYEMEEGAGKFSKLIGYIKFRKYVLNILRRIDYSGIILLQTNAGIILSDFLNNKYKYRYVVDIRDYSMEKNPIYFNIESKLIKNSAFTVISSKGYEFFLPKYNYTLVHNDILVDNHTVLKFKNKKRYGDKIIISYIGLIRFHEENKKIIMKFKNDERFIIRFIGKDALSLSTFCKNNNVKNVELIDQFPPEKTLKYYYETDIILNLYGNNTPLLDYALSNKLYYAAILYLPILVSPNTYMEKVAVKNGFGYSFDIKYNNELDRLYAYYYNIDWQIFFENCNKFLVQVKKENKDFEEKVRAFVV